MPSTVDIQDFISSRKLSGFQTTVLVLCFIVVAVDGFDTAAVGYVAPALVAQWNVTRSQLAPQGQPPPPAAWVRLASPSRAHERESSRDHHIAATVNVP